MINAVDTRQRCSQLGLVALTVTLASAAWSADVAGANAVHVTPSWQRCEVASGQSTEMDVLVSSDAATSITAIETDCGCVSTSTKLPAQLDATQPTTLHFRIVGIRAGVKVATIHTPLGVVTTSFQVVTSGIGTGSEVLSSLLQEAKTKRQRLVLIAHDLRGALRNCGCSAGALGGIDRLAALPAACQHEAPTVQVDFVLTGDVDGLTPGVESALVKHAWRRDSRVFAAPDVAEALASHPDLLAVVVPPTSSVNHQRAVRPLLDRGMCLDALLVRDDGSIAAHEHLPVDRSLMADPTVLDAFPQPLSVEIREAVPSDRCLGCHRTAHAIWAESRHAHAWAALAPKDRVDACIQCHTTPLSPERPDAVAPRAQNVHCQACHLGSDAHADDVRVHTAGLTDCRTCHDVRQHPSFRPELWEVIRHGLELTPAKAVAP